MSRKAQTILFAVLSVAWCSFVGLNWIGSLLGDCYETNFTCLAYKEFGPTLVLWRGAAIQLGATLLFALFRKA